MLNKSKNIVLRGAVCSSLSFVLIFISILVVICPIVSYGDINAEEKFVQKEQAKRIIITVNQYVSHVALDSAYQGFIKSLRDRKIIPQKAKIIFSNAQGNISNAVQISKYHASLRPTFLVGIATPVVQTLLKSFDKNTSKLGFLAVSNPSVAKLFGREGVIGVTDMPDLDKAVNLAKKIIPNLKTVGVLYNHGEINSVSIVNKFEKILYKNSIKLEKAVVNNSGDIRIALQRIIDKVEAIYIPHDNTAVSAIDSIISIAKKAKLPVFSSDPTLVCKGVLFASGADYYQSGEQLGNMIADLIEGKKLDSDIQNTNVQNFKFNSQMGELLNIKLPSDFDI